MKKSEFKKLLALFQAGKYDEMEVIARAIIKKNPKDGKAWKALGSAVKRQGGDGLEATRKAVELLPTDYEAHFNLGVELQNRGKQREAIECYTRAIQLNPNSGKVYNNLGNALKAISKPYDAMNCYQRAIQLDPKATEYYLNFGNDLLTMGMYAKAVACYRRALDINQDFIEAYSNLIFTQDFMTVVDAKTHLNARKDWAESYVDHLFKNIPNENDIDPHRKLRIGYVSGDFKEHSAARVFGAMLIDYDRRNFDVFCYFNNITPGDSYTERFRNSATGWRAIGKMGDEEVEKLIRDDHIDILVDLSGHSALHRLAVFALHPAPVQITAWGYATSTGLQKMDYFFADPIVVPESERVDFVEEIVDLPCVVGSYFPEPFPDIGPLPAKENGVITFGCLNRLHKITEECYSTWAGILKAIPNSRLLLKAGELSDEQTRTTVVWQFMRAGVNPDRIKLLGATPWINHVRAYNLIDIALDPFPHCGGVTTMEGLLMGVPPVTLRWPTLVGRTSASMLTVLGMEDWIAETANDYIALAVRKAGEIDTLGAVREGLRQRFQASSIGDSKQYVAAVEGRYRQLWKRWCSDQTTKVLDKLKIAS